MEYGLTTDAKYYCNLRIMYTWVPTISVLMIEVFDFQVSIYDKAPFGTTTKYLSLFLVFSFVHEGSVCVSVY